MVDASTEKKRPVCLNLVRLCFDLPLRGILSILHRTSGAMQFFFLFGFLLSTLLRDRLASAPCFAGFSQTVVVPQ
jgi:succinate dehydrogenase/fumarate reductase cytochrome b subunit